MLESDLIKPDEKIALKTYLDAEKLSLDVSINLADLDTAMVEHASLYVHYATNTVKARKQYDRIKSTVEILKSRLYNTHRKMLAEELGKVTEGMIEHAVVTDPKWASAQALLIEAQSIWKLAEIGENAFSQRKDLVLEVARDRRKEREGAMRVMGIKDARDNVLGILKNKD